MKNFKQLFFKKTVLSLHLVLFNFFGLVMSGQTCNPDVTPPTLKLKPEYITWIDNSSSGLIKVADLIESVGDNCTPKNQIILSFSTNPNDNTISVNIGTSVIATVYATDNSKNSASAQITIKVSYCSLAMACNDNVILKVNPGSTIPATPDLFLEGNYCSDHAYEYSYKLNNVNIPFTEISTALPSDFVYYIKSKVTGNTCWGNAIIVPFDCSAENDFEFLCNDQVTQCSKSTYPEDLGLPWASTWSTEHKPNTNEYNLFLSANCKKTTVNYTDVFITNDCANPYIAQIDRKWTATLPNGVIKTCTQQIKFDRSKSSLFESLHNYDGIDFPVLNCQDNWKRLDPNNEFLPSPDYTGNPIQSACLNSTMGATLNDLIITVQNGTCGKDYKIIRKWTVLNWCTGESFEHNQIIKVQCQKDANPPTLVLKNNIDVYYSPLKSNQLDVLDVDNGSFDDCTFADLYFDASLSNKILSFGTPDIGKSIQVNVYGVDQNKNLASSSVTVHVYLDTFPLDTMVLISGNILDYNLKPVTYPVNFKFELNHQSSKYILNKCQSLSIPPHNYSLCANLPNTVSDGYLKPSVNKASPLNGVTTFDVFALIRYLFGINSLNSYQRIAADVNCDDQLNITDIFLMRKLILGIVSNFPCDDVQFYNADQNRPSLIESKLLTGFPVHNLNIVPVKKGDLNNSSIFLKDEKIYSREQISFYFDNINMVAGNTYDIWLRTEKPLSIYGLQLGQIFDPNKIQILNISSPFLSITKDNEYVVNERDWRGLFMTSDLEKFTIQNGFLKISIKALQSGKAKDAILENSYPLPIFLINSNLELTEVFVYPKNITSNNDVTIDKQNWLVISPNPSSNDVQLISKSKISRIELFNAEGKKCFDLDSKLDSEVIKQIPAKAFQNSGLYYLKVQSNNETQTIKISRQ